MKVRRATPADAAAVERVARASWHAAYDAILGAHLVDSTVDEWYELPALRRASILDAHHLFVADDGGVVGFAHAAPGSESGAYALIRLYVRPDRWGEGIGTELLDRVVGAVRGDCDRLELTVYAENDVGVRFYEAKGFERVGSGTDEHGNEELHYARPISR